MTPLSAGPTPEITLTRVDFAGGVVAHQGDHLPGPDLQLDVLQRLDGGEPLGDTAQSQQGLSRHGVTSFRSGEDVK